MNIYRYLDTEHVENFFDIGTLMLSSFGRCRRHEDARADDREGKSNFLINMRGQILAGIRNGGESTLLLCTSRSQSDYLKKKFRVNDRFKIARPLHFVAVIAEYLEDVQGFRIGDVRYNDGGVETSHSESLSSLMPDLFNLEDSDQKELDALMEGMRKTLSELIHSKVGDDGLFVKRESYADEAEFRFCWTISKPVDDSMPITCHDAVKYCWRE